MLRKLSPTVMPMSISLVRFPHESRSENAPTESTPANAGKSPDNQLARFEYTRFSSDAREWAYDFMLHSNKYLFKSPKARSSSLSQLESELERELSRVSDTDFIIFIFFVFFEDYYYFFFKKKKNNNVSTHLLFFFFCICL